MFLPVLPSASLCSLTVRSGQSSSFALPVSVAVSKYTSFRLRCASNQAGLPSRSSQRVCDVSLIARLLPLCGIRRGSLHSCSAASEGWFTDEPAPGTYGHSDQSRSWSPYRTSDCLRLRSEEHTSELQSLRHLVCR